MAWATFSTCDLMKKADDDVDSDDGNCYPQGQGKALLINVKIDQMLQQTKLH